MTRLMVYLTLLLCLPAVVSKLSLMPRWVRLAYGAVGGLFCLLMTDTASHAPQSQVTLFLSSQTTRQYLAMAVTLELVLLLSYAFRPRRSDVKSVTLPLRRPERPARRRTRRLLAALRKYYVTLLLFPALFVLQVQLLYALPGVDFRLPAAIAGASALLFLPLLSEVIRALLPDEESRESLAVGSSALLCVAALLSTVTDSLLYLPSETSSAGASVPLAAVPAVLLLFVGSTLLERLHKYRLLR